MEYVYQALRQYAIVFIVFIILVWIIESIYLKITRHKDHPSRYVNEIFYEESMKQED